jgi:hypothetical protein
MKPSVLDIGATPLTDLKPGETGLRLKDDPYYGKVDIGPTQGEGGDDTKLKDWEKKEREKISAMPASQQTAAEEKLGKDLAKKRKSSKLVDPDNPVAVPANATASELHVALGYLEETIDSGAHVLDGEEQGRIEVLTGKRLQQKAPEAEPREAEDVGEGIEGAEGERAASKGNAMEPPERERDKTKAAKPGESAKS